MWHSMSPLSLMQLECEMSPKTLMCLNTWSPAGSTDFEGWGSLGSLGGGSGSLGLGVSLEVLYLAHFLPVSCFLFHHDLREQHTPAAMELPATEHFPPWLTVSTQTESRNKPFAALGCFLPRTYINRKRNQDSQWLLWDMDWLVTENDGLL